MKNKLPFELSRAKEYLEKLEEAEDEKQSDALVYITLYTLVEYCISLEERVSSLQRAADRIHTDEYKPPIYNDF